MAEKPAHRRPKPGPAHEPPPAADAYAFHGRQVRVTRHAEHGHDHLEIDGRRIPVETRESGVMSPMFMFQEFPSVHELAEALIRDWGTWRPPDDAYVDPHVHPPADAPPGDGPTPTH